MSLWNIFCFLISRESFWSIIYSAIWGLYHFWLSFLSCICGCSSCRVSTHAEICHKITELGLDLLVNLLCLLFLGSHLLLFAILTFAVLLCLLESSGLFNSLKFIDLCLLFLSQGLTSFFLASLGVLLTSNVNFFLSTELHLIEVWWELDESELLNEIFIRCQVWHASSRCTSVNHDCLPIDKAKHFLVV